MRLPVYKSWHDPIVAEVRQARQTLFAEANYDVREFCRQLSARQEALNHRIVQLGEVKAMLGAAAPISMSEARGLAGEWQRRLAGKIKGDSSELIREDRER